LSIAPRAGLKEAILHEIYTSFGLSVREHSRDNILIQAKQHIMLSDLVLLLNILEVDTVRMVQYGMKWCPAIDDTFYNILRAHPLAVTNTFDVGMMYTSEGYMPLLKVTMPSRTVTEHRTWPMLIDLGGGYGSVQFKYKEFNIKCYPRIVHSLKAYSPNISTKMPERIKTLRDRQETLLGMKQWLGTRREQLHGLRIEVRIGRPTIEEAIEAANRPFDLLEITNIVDLLGSNCIKLVSVEEYLENLNVICDAAVGCVFRGDDQERITSNKLSKYRDVLNAFGFNPGWFGSQRPTTETQNAWWLEGANRSNDLPTQSLPTLFNLYKDRLKCEACGHNKFHTVGGRQGFRLRCAKYPYCKASYREHKLKEMFGKLCSEQMQSETQPVQRQVRWAPELEQTRIIGGSSSSQDGHMIEAEQGRENISLSKEEVLSSHGPDQLSIEEPSEDSHYAEIRRYVQFYKKPIGDRGWQWRNQKGKWSSAGSFQTIDECVEYIWRTWGGEWKKYVEHNRPTNSRDRIVLEF
jgi:hypothetical protein